MSCHVLKTQLDEVQYDKTGSKQLIKRERERG